MHPLVADNILMKYYHENMTQQGSEHVNDLMICFNKKSVVRIIRGCRCGRPSLELIAWFSPRSFGFSAF